MPAVLLTSGLPPSLPPRPLLPSRSRRSSWRTSSATTPARPSTSRQPQDAEWTDCRGAVCRPTRRCSGGGWLTTRWCSRRWRGAEVERGGGGEGREGREGRRGGRGGRGGGGEGRRGQYALLALFESSSGSTATRVLGVQQAGVEACSRMTPPHLTPHQRAAATCGAATPRTSAAAAMQVFNPRPHRDDGDRSAATPRGGATSRRDSRCGGGGGGRGAGGGGGGGAGSGTKRRASRVRHRRPSTYEDTDDACNMSDVAYGSDDSDSDVQEARKRRRRVGAAPTPDGSFFRLADRVGGCCRVLLSARLPYRCVLVAPMRPPRPHPLMG